MKPTFLASVLFASPGFCLALPASAQDSINGPTVAAAIDAAMAQGAPATDAAPLQEAVAPAVTAAAPAPAGEDAAALAQQLSNPVAALISVPFQFNFDGDIGPERDGSRITLNVQPVIPISLNEDWNIISRTILPILWQDNIYPGAGSQFGLGDVVQSVFLSPAKPGAFIWGAGPVLLVPTGTDDLLSGRKWGGGPTGVILKQMGPWTVGGLANHIWSFAGNSARNDISATYVNPFLSYATKSAFTVTVAADINYDWKGDNWVVPVNLIATQVTKLGGQLVSVGGGFRYYVATSEGSPHGLAARFVVTLLFPKK